MYCLFLSTKIDFLKGFHLPIASESKIWCFSFYLLVFSRSQMKAELNLHPCIFKAYCHCLTRRTFQQYYRGTCGTVYCQHFCSATHHKMETRFCTQKSNLCERICTGCLCSHHQSLNLQTIVQCLPHVCFQVNTTTDGRFFHPALCQYLSCSFHGCIIDFQQGENTWSSHTLQIHLLNSLDTTLCATVPVKITLPETSRREDLSNKACLVAQEVGFSTHLALVQMFSFTQNTTSILRDRLSNFNYPGQRPCFFIVLV